MFQGVRQNSILYILETTDDGLKVQIGDVVSVSNPQPRYNQFSGTPTFGTQPEMVVDIKVKIGDDEMDFKQLGANQTIANSNNVIVSDSREAINAEVDSLVAKSKRHIEAIPYHEKIIETSVNAKKITDPQFAKEKEQEAKIGALEERMGDIDDKLSRMYDLLSDTLGHNKSKKSKEE